MKTTFAKTKDYGLSFFKICLTGFIFAGCQQQHLPFSAQTGEGSTSSASNLVALSLAVDSSSSAPNLVLDLNMSIGNLNNSPAGIEWYLTYNTQDFIGITVTPGPVAIAAGKLLQCASPSEGISHCLIVADPSNPNEAPISNGVLALLTLGINSASSNPTSVLQLNNGVSTSPVGVEISTSTRGLSVSFE